MLSRATPLTPAYGAAYPQPTSGARSHANLWMTLAGAALLGWTVYAAPTARREALALAQPWLGGLVPATPGLTFADVHARRGELNGQTVLYVEGSVTNAGAARRKAPGLVVTLVGDDGRPLYKWKAKTAKPDVEAGGSVAFQARLMSPPEPYKNIAVTFAEGG